MVCLRDDARKHEQRGRKAGQERRKCSKVRIEVQGPREGHWPHSHLDPLRGQAEFSLRMVPMRGEEAGLFTYQLLPSPDES